MYMCMCVCVCVCVWPENVSANSEQQDIFVSICADVGSDSTDHDSHTPDLSLV